MKIICIVLYMTLVVGLQAGTDFYVSPAGNDDNAGTEQHPFRTITKAQFVVRDIVKSGLKDNVTIHLDEGIYRIEKPLQFDCRDSGTEKHKITYRSSSEKSAIISGGKVLSGWKMRRDGLWECATGPGKVRELFVNGARAQRARHPNQGYLRVVEASEDRMSFLVFKAGDVPVGFSANNSELVFIHDWSISRVGVKEVDMKASRIFPLSGLGRQHPMMVIDGYEPNPRYALENDSTICDSAGEWYQKANGNIVYFPGTDETIDETEFIVPIAGSLLTVEGDEAGRCIVQNLHFEDLVFAHCRYDPPPEGYAGVQATFHMVEGPNGFEKGWRAYVPGAIRFELAENCSFRHGEIKNLGGSGIMFGSRTLNCVLDGTHILDVSGNAVMIGESRDRTVDGKVWWQADAGQAARGNVVKDCLIEEAGRQYSGAVGIWVGLAQQILISHNEIRDLPYTGISVGWMWNPDVTPCHSNRVEYNHIHHVMQTLSDGGGIYTLGLQPGTVLEANLIHDIPLNAGRAESNGMFLDEGTTDILIGRNIIYNTDKSPLRFHKAGVNKVVENILVRKSDVPPVRYNNTPERNIELLNNRVMTAAQETEDSIRESVRNMEDKAGPRR